jgi:superfamily II DNA or RNA helicase
MAFVPLRFQSTIIEGVLARLRQQDVVYRELVESPLQMRDDARLRGAGIVLQAPTGSGKTAIAIEVMARFSREAKVLWFWFAPFAGLVEQAANALRAQAPQLALLDLGADRRLGAVVPGAVFVTTWSAVAASNADARRARVTGDTGVALDALLAQAREQGYRIGCVVDEAHHGFHKAKQAQAFFRDILRPDHALMMTATPKDADVVQFEKDTGYRLGDPADWASVARADAVDEGLLKRGVRTVRFLARDDDTKQLVDFEHLALRECAQAHRQIAQRLKNVGIALTPLMLVQVPDGKKAMADARAYLVQELGFADAAVRIHTSDEPDPDLIALAHDPGVEVLIFKMAVALGFDAPRAFTLAALRGARDASFGVQIIGRIVRVHALLQRRTDIPPELSFGYVFLANAESQEGLTAAGQQINALKTSAPSIGAGLTVTYCGMQRTVQVVDAGQSFELKFGDDPSPVAGARVEPEQVPAPWRDAAQLALAMGSGAGVAGPSVTPNGPVSGLAGFALQATRTPHRYPRRPVVPERLVGERLPPAPADIELRLVDFVAFTDEVLACRDKVRTSVRRSEVDVFAGSAIGEDGRDVYANLAPEAVAHRAQQVMDRLAELNQRELRLRLLARFRQAIEATGAMPPDDEETLEQQLDLVLVRRPSLLRDAFRSMRHRELVTTPVVLPAEFVSDQALEPAQRNAFGVFPEGLNSDEEHVARVLDGSPLVRWWHRNRADARLPDALGLYRWDDGDGFFPDFVVSIEGRESADHVALLEVKGDLFRSVAKEVDKASAELADYGQVFMVGRRKGEKGLNFLRSLGGRLEAEGPFDVARMRWR